MISPVTINFPPKVGSKTTTIRSPKVDASVIPGVVKSKEDKFKITVGLEESKQKLYDAAASLYDQQEKQLVNAYKIAGDKGPHDTYKRLVDATRHSLNEVKNFKYDPDHFWHNMSNTSKALTILGEGLFAAGNAFYGQPTAVNRASRIIDSAIQRDMVAQNQQGRQLGQNYQMSRQMQNDYLHQAKTMVNLMLGKMAMNTKSLGSKQAIADLAKDYKPRQINELA